MTTNSLGKEGENVPIIEPLQKWQLPVDVVDMSSSCCGSYSTASMITSSGILYNWTSMSGITKRHFKY